LGKDPKESEVFFRGLLDMKGTTDRDWVRWNHAFSLLQAKSPREAQKELVSLVESSRDQLLQLLSLYLLDVLTKEDVQLEKKVNEAREGLRSRTSAAELTRAIEKAGGNMEIIVLGRMLRDAVEWLFAASPAAGAAPSPARVKSPPS
jgi:hypothetical protein